MFKRKNRGNLPDHLLNAPLERVNARQSRSYQPCSLLVIVQIVQSVLLLVWPTICLNRWNRAHGSSPPASAMHSLFRSLVLARASASARTIGWPWFRSAARFPTSPQQSLNIKLENGRVVFHLDKRKKTHPVPTLCLGVTPRLGHTDSSNSVSTVVHGASSGRYKQTAYPL